MKAFVRRFVDTHVHFFDLEAETGLTWSWLGVNSADGLVPEMGPIAAKRFTPAELWAEGARTAGLVKCVHIEAATGTENHLLETMWLDELRGQYEAPHAAIAHVSLEAPDARDQLEALLAYPWVRGIRDLGKTPLLDDDLYVDRVAGLADRGMLFELLCGRRRFAAVAELARRCPDTTIVLEHFGLAPVPGAPAFGEWRAELQRFDELRNVVLKLSGLGLAERGWQFGDAQVLVEAALEVFGTDRCVVGTNWPMDRVAASYPDVVLAIAAACGDLSMHEADAILAGNAERLYRL